jgi:hypothetical protein
MRTAYLFFRPLKNPPDPEFGVGRDGMRSCTFADPGWLDVVPVTGGSPAVSRPSIPGGTFQSAPNPDQADGRMLQSALPGGLVVGMMDGHTRVIRAGITEEAFWAAVTPAAGDAAPE